MFEFFRKLFDADDFPPRWQCGAWSDFDGWFDIGSDLGVWSAYMTIPVLLVAFLRRRPDLPFRKAFALFAAFIFLCGTTHLCLVCGFWWPAYRLYAVIKCATALVSWVTVGALLYYFPLAVRIHTPSEYEEQILQTEETGDYLATVLETAFSGILVTDLNAVVLYANATIERLFGYRRDQIVGQSVDRLLPERAWLLRQNGMERARQTGEIRPGVHVIETKARRFDGGEIDVNVAIVLWGSRRRAGFTAFIRDISELKAAENALLSKNTELEREALARRLLETEINNLRQLREDQDQQISATAKAVGRLDDIAGSLTKTLNELNKPTAPAEGR